MSISYLGLTREQLVADGPLPDPEWRQLVPLLPLGRTGATARNAPAGAPRRSCRELRKLGSARRRPNWRASGGSALRVEINFGDGRKRWNEELVLQRYELLYEAGLVAEAGLAVAAPLGMAMRYDHRRILATGIARLRAKIKYRPVVFELMPESFTLLRLQRSVEARPPVACCTSRTSAG